MVEHTAQMISLSARRVKREARMDLIRNVAAAVMLGDQLEIDARRVTLARLVLDTKVWDRDFVSHDLESMTSGNLRTGFRAQPGHLAIDFPLEFVVENHTEIASTLRFNPHGFFLV